MDLRKHDWTSDPIFDSAILSHGFTPYMRDYDLIIEVPGVRPDGTGSYIEGRYRYRFTHCIEAAVRSNVRPEVWRESWGDEFIDYTAWQEAGEPAGFLWAVEWAGAYPGVEYVPDLEGASSWSEAVGKPMHGIRIETNAYAIDLVCHDLAVTRLAAGDPTTGELTPVD